MYISYICVNIDRPMLLGGKSIEREREGSMVNEPASLVRVAAPRKCLPAQEAEQRCESCGVQLEDEMILGCPTLGREPVNIPLLIGYKWWFVFGLMAMGCQRWEYHTRWLIYSWMFC